MDSIKNLKDLEISLGKLLIPDSRIIKESENLIKKFSKDPSCLPAFFQIILKKTEISTGVRHMAATLMRHKVKSQWKKLDPKLQDGIKNGLLQIIIEEPQILVRNAVLRVISQIAALEIPAGKWNDLAKYISTIFQSKEYRHRETAMLLCSFLFEQVGDEMKNSFDHFLQLFQAGLKDENPNVRIATLKALESLANNIEHEKEILQFQKIIPLILEVVRHCIQEEEEEIVSSIFDLFAALFQLNFDSFNECISPLIQFMCEIAANRKNILSLRLKSMDFIGFMVQQKPRQMIKLLEFVFKVIFHLLVEEEDDSVDQDEETSHKSASAVLDTVAVFIPSKFVFRPVVEYSINNLIKSNNPNERKAGITAIAILSEGCLESMKQNITLLIPILINGLKDQNQKVREVSFLAVHAFIEYLQPEIFEYIDQILPYCILMLNDPSDDVKEKAVFSLDAISQHIGEGLGKYANEIMQTIMELLTKGSRRVQEIAISAISPVALAIGANFLPYCDTIFKLMTELMIQLSSDDIILRCKATECIGNIAVAIGKQNFAPLATGYMKIATEGLSIDSCELREYSYGFFQNIATCLEEDFAVFLPTIFNLMIHSTVCEDSVAQDENKTTSFLNDEEEEDDEDEEEDYLNDLKLEVRTSVIDEKAAAISALGVICEVCKEKYLPYWKHTYESFIVNTSHYHEDIKRFAVSGLKNLFSIFKSNDITKELKESLNEVSFIFTTMIADDDDKETVARICEAFSGLLQNLGKNIFDENQLGQLVNSIVDVLKQDAACNENDYKDEEADHDAVLMIAVSDLIDDLARSYGKDFAPYLKELFLPILNYAKDGRSDTDKVMAIGTLSEISNSVGDQIIPYSDTLIQLFTSGSKSMNMNIKRNSIFGIGVLALVAPKQTEKVIMQVLQILHPVIKEPMKYSNFVVDNSAGCLARIIISHGSNIPMDQVLGGLVQVLPLREDFVENDIIYGCLLDLLKNGHPSVAKLMGPIISLFSRVLATNGFNISRFKSR
eukprot:gene1706-475_t